MFKYDEEKYENKRFKRWDVYVTGGTCAGRILVCTKPFNRGGGVYKQSMNDADWRLLGNKTMSESVLHEHMKKIHDVNLQALKNTVKRHYLEGYRLVASADGFYRIVHIAKS